MRTWKTYFPIILAGGLIPAVIILSLYFHISQTAVIPILIILTIAFLSMLLWRIANRNADGSEWWQDDNASGWRGY